MGRYIGESLLWIFTLGVPSWIIGLQLRDRRQARQAARVARTQHPVWKLVDKPKPPRLWRDKETENLG